jgi:hypothetical protein
VQARGLTLEVGSPSGFTVSGQRVTSVTARPGIAAKVMQPSEAIAASVVEVDLGPFPSASIALRFADGSGTILAALRFYVGNVVAGDTGVSNVSYVPSKGSPLRSAYEAEAGRVDALRASVATAAQFGVFRFEGNKQERARAAAAMGDRIRVLKGIDPTLGLYAAYAYDDANLKDKVKSVRGYMRSDLQVDLCDVGMLSGELSSRAVQDWKAVAPFCPMLSQGWGLIRVKNLQLPDRIAVLRDHLRVSLWNSLSPDGMKIAEEALRSGLVG